MGRIENHKNKYVKRVFKYACINLLIRHDTHMTAFPNVIYIMMK